MMNMLNNTSGRIVTDASKKIEDFVFAKWDESIVDSLKEYIEIPNVNELHQETKQYRNINNCLFPFRRRLCSILRILQMAIKKKPLDTLPIGSKSNRSKI